MDIQPSKEIIEFLTTTALAGDIDSQVSLGLYNMQGIDGIIEPDLDTAAIWLDMAKDNPNCVGEYSIHITRHQADLCMQIGNYETAAKYYSLVLESIQKSGDYYWVTTMRYIKSISKTDPKKSYQMRKDLLLREDLPTIYRAETAELVAEYDLTINPLDAINHLLIAIRLNEKWLSDQLIGVNSKLDDDSDKKNIIDIVEEHTKNMYNSLGFAYELIGDYANAHHNYKIAHDAGILFASNNLGYLYGRGLGCDPNVVVSAEYYTVGESRYVEWSTARKKIYDNIKSNACNK